MVKDFFKFLKTPDSSTEKKKTIACDEKLKACAFLHHPTEHRRWHISTQANSHPSKSTFSWKKR